MPAMTKVIKVSDEVYRKLKKLAEELGKKKGRRVTMSEVIEELLEEQNRRA